jgi:predicted porin
LTFGDTEYAAAEYWNGVSEMDEDNFSEVDGEDVIKVSGKFGGFEGAVSTGVNTETGETYQSSFGVKGTFGNVNVSAAYQEGTTKPETLGLYDAAVSNVSEDAYDNGDYTYEEIFALSVGTSFAGMDVTVAYAESEGENSTGIEVTYPVGDVTLSAFYVSESALDDNYGVSAVYAANAIVAKAYYKSLNGSDEYGLGGSYTMDDLVLTAGYVDGDSLTDDDFAAYIVADYNLGGGASVMASYADGSAGGVNSDDIDTVIGGYELYDGLTVELGFKF